MTQHLAKKFKLLIALVLGITMQHNLQGQATNYTPLFTNATFTKTIDVNLPVGTVAASADATAGSASYSIPIAVPPGTNGVVPSVAVVYNSLGGNGVAGYGWSISGLSMITRIGQTIYHNGTLRPVDFSVNDHFSLDGTRLILKTGTYGSNGATYGAEMENFAAITSNGAMGGGPQWFSVVTKDGITMEYGNTTDSRFLNHDNTKVLYWRLNKILYTDGNYIEFKYTNLDRDSRIDEINYTGNAAAGLLPYNKLKFTYTVRTDVNTTYEAQASIVSKYLLDKITVTAEGNAAFKTYTFKYGFNNVNSFLKEVIEAGSNGTALNSTIFKYGDIPATFQTGSSSAIAGQQVDVYTGDFNADGYSDVLACTRNVVDNIVYHTEFKVYKKSPSPLNNTFTLSATMPLPSNYIVFKPFEGANSFVFTADYTGDGADDVATVKTTGTGSSRVLNEMRIYTSQSDATSFANPTVIPPYTNYSKIHTNGHYFFSGDFNGDGVTDMLTMLGHNTSGTYASHMYFGSISSSFGTVGITGSYNFAISAWPTVDRVQVIDFNGDGKSDLMLIKDGTCEIFTFDNYVARSLYVSGFPTKWHLLFFGDFNGDRKTDILCRTSTTNNNNPWYKAISTGTGFVETPFTFSHTPDINEYYYGDKLFISDFNGDGKGDVCHGWNYWVNPTTLASKIDMYYSRGDNFYSEQYSYSKSFVSAPNVLTFDADADGRADILNRGYYGDPFDILYFNKEGKELLLEKVKNGVDHTTQWSYKRMTEGGTFYTRGNLTAQPLNNVQLPMNLVYEFKSQDGIGGNTTTQYSYEEAKLHKTGKGLIGLKKETGNNLTTGMKTVLENEFSASFYAAVPYKTSTYLASNNSLLNEVTLTNEFVNLSSKKFWHRVNSSYENKAFEGRFISSSNSYDAYGNVTQKTTNHNNVETTVNTTTYAAYGTLIPDKPVSVNITRTRSGQTAYTMPTTYFAYNTLGQMTSRTDFSAQQQNVVTSYTYNNLGNRTGTTVSPAGMTARTETKTYDSKGRFALTTTNALGQSSSATYDPKWSKPLSQTGVDGLTTSYNYDAFGRLQTTIMPQGWIVTESYGWDVNTTEGTIHYRYTSHPGKPDVKVWYDLLDREKKAQTEGFQSQWITAKTTYDARGNTATATAPYKSGETILTTTNTYDAYNRLVSASNTIGTTSYAYAFASGNLTTTTTNPAGQVSSKVSDAVGQTVSATDNGGTLTYTYNSQGKLTQVKLGATTLVTNEYDIYGRQTKLIDINAGTTQYAYDALGELISQTNAKGQTHTMQYDLLGRLTQKTEPGGAITTHEYFPAGTAAANRLKKTTGFAGNLEEYTYDAYGRTSTVKETIDGTAHTTAYTYNTYGDVISTAYPSGFTLNTNYDVNGYLSTLKNGNNTVTLFTNTGMNGLNQYKFYTLGNGKSSQISYYFGTPTNYITTGVQNLYLNWNYQSRNLNFRNDGIKGITEIFTYDNLNRLLSSSITGQPSITVTYAANGNISSKSDVGNYTYSTTKINAVEHLTNPSSVIPGAFQTVAYTAFHQPATITEGSYELAFTYGADYERRKTVLKQNNVVTETRYFFGNYEKRIAGSTTQHIHYFTGAGLNAIVVRENGTDTYYYTYTDHIGSILTVTNSAGAVVAEQNFDAWGRMRNPSTWTYTSVPTPPVWLYRGFTGHEHLPQFSLINMNGRLYDPLMARMLSVDNYVQSPLSSQNYNRYSYALNNPLQYNDPNGEWIHIVVGAFVGAVANVVVGALNGEIKDGWDLLAYAGTGAAIGALASATGGATLAATGLSASSVAGGALAGAVGGAVGGALQGATNATYQTLRYNAPSKNIGKSALNGFVGGAIIGGVVGGVAGGISGYLHNAKYPNAQINIWTGRPAPVRISGSGIEIGEITGEFPNTNTLEFDGGSQIINGEIVPYYPPNGGAAGAWTEQTLMPGQILDRYGSNAGSYLSPEGTPFAMRALPPATNQSNYHVFEVLKPTPVLQSTVAPWFGQPGGGVQYYTRGITIDYLIEFGFLRQIR